VSDHDKRESAQTRTDDLLEGFDAFRSRGAGRPQPPEPEPFPDAAVPYAQENQAQENQAQGNQAPGYEIAQTAMPTVISPVVDPPPLSGLGAEPTLPMVATGFSATAEYTAVPPPPPFVPGSGKGVAAIPGSRPPRRSKTRTGFILAAVAAIVIGLCAGAYSVVVRTDRSSQNSSVPPAASASASPQADDAENSKAVTALVVVDSVTANGFVATAQAGGDKFAVQYTATTKFGTQARPLTRAQVVPGAHVWVRGHRTAYDTITATVVAGALESEASTTRSSGSVGV
jgi:hypothetical protein